MHKYFLKITLLAILATSIVATGIGMDNRSSLQKAENYFEQRYKNAKKLKADPSILNKAIKNYKKALKIDSTKEQAILGLLKTYRFKGKFADIPKKEKIKSLEKGVELGKESVKKYPGHIEFTYWYMVNLGQWSKTVGAMKAKLHGVVGQLLELAHQVIDEAPEYDDAGGYRILGGMHLKVPTIPFIITWPSSEKALTYLSNAYRLAPQNIANNVLYAQALMEADEQTKATAILRKVVQRKPRKENYFDDLIYLQKAEDILEAQQ